MLQVRIECLADHLELVSTLARLHREEWGGRDPAGFVRSWTAALGSPTGRGAIPTTFVALAGDDVAGSVTLVERDVLVRPGLSPWLAGLYVVPALRRRGVGSSLAAHCADAAGAMGGRTLYLYASEAEGFYARLGWFTCERLMYQGTPVSLMQKPLAGSGRSRPPPGGGTLGTA